MPAPGRPPGARQLETRAAAIQLGRPGLAAASLLVRLFDLATGWAQLIVAVVFALVGYALVRSGLSKLKTSNLVPERTAEQLSRDAQVAKETVR